MFPPIIVINLYFLENFVLLLITFILISLLINLRFLFLNKVPFNKPVSVKIWNPLLIPRIKHPDLADKTKIAKLTSYSKKEQKDSNLNQCTPNEYYRFKELNKKYKNKFGFPFIMAVSGKKKYQILSSFEKRVMLKKNTKS